MKITPKQADALLTLRNGARSAYPGLHMGTLQALERKGFVVAKRGLGSMAMPQTAIKWFLTLAGREFCDWKAAVGHP